MLKIFGGGLLFAFSIFAQTSTLPATDVTSADIQAFLKALPPDAVNDKPIRVVDVGGYHLAVFGVLRPKSVGIQEANLHQTKASEIYYILEGGGTLVTGGTLINPKPMAPGSTNLQGPGINGGVSRHLSKGDVVIIPGRTPHWWSKTDGDIKYLIIRTDPESKIPLK